MALLIRIPHRWQYSVVRSSNITSVSICQDRPPRRIAEWPASAPSKKRLIAAVEASALNLSPIMISVQYPLRLGGSHTPPRRQCDHPR